MATVCPSMAILSLAVTTVGPAARDCKKSVMMPQLLSSAAALPALLLPSDQMSKRAEPTEDVTCWTPQWPHDSAGRRARWTGGRGSSRREKTQKRAAHSGSPPQTEAHAVTADCREAAEVRCVIAGCIYFFQVQKNTVWRIADWFFNQVPLICLFS